MIFILEDSPHRIEWFEQHFGKENIFCTCDYKEAIEKLSSEEFEKVYLDYNISSPKYNGVDIAFDMVDYELQKDVPVIIHSDDNYGIRNMMRILGKTHQVEAITFNKLIKEAKK